MKSVYKYDVTKFKMVQESVSGFIKHYTKELDLTQKAPKQLNPAKLDLEDINQKQEVPIL